MNPESAPIKSKSATLPAKPFLKWAGGKSQLIEKISAYFPPEICAGKITKYAEPFIGGGALFFYIAQNHPEIKSFYISDANAELTIAYQTIQRDVDSLIAALAAIEEKYHSLTREEQKEFFYETRSGFNSKLTEINFKEFQPNWIQRTATIIFLNRTCFNGLFRVNSKGEFNVPFGDYKNPKISDPENLIAVSNLLQKTSIEHADFTGCQHFVDDETFVYFDPPYRPISQTASFNSYAKSSFGDDEQTRLSEFFRLLDEKNAWLMLSNSDPKNINPNDNFFENAYQGFQIERVKATRIINSKAEKRGQINELLIMNY